MSRTTSKAMYIYQAITNNKLSRIFIVVLIKNWQDGVFINVQPAPNFEKNNINVYAYWKHELFFVHYLDLGLFILFYITGISHTFRFC